MLDPVFIDRSEPRAAFAKRLLAKKPTALRLNEAEFNALGGKPVDVAKFARSAAAKRTVIGLTGERDIVCDATRMATVANGDPLMAKVTAMGCAGSAVVAAFLAVESDAWLATAAALTVAIPAVFGYNIFANRLNRVAARVDGFGSEVIGLMAREGRL